MIRLFVTSPLAADVPLELSNQAHHYLAHVMRCSQGDSIALFNANDGEWEAQITVIGKKKISATPIKQTRPALDEKLLNVSLAFAPIKKDRLALMLEKACELGVKSLTPVLTQYTQTPKLNIQRLSAHLIEAAEQTERISVPSLAAPCRLKNFLDSFDPSHNLIVCAESGQAVPLPSLVTPAPSTLLIGPEGGFSDEEFNLMRTYQFIQFGGLGPSVLRADTAAIAALSCWAERTGHWDTRPPKRS